jgi:hypothetical protein
MGRDFGTTVEVLSGVSGDDRVVVNPPDSLEEGQTVQVAAPGPKAPDDEGTPQ